MSSKNRNIGASVVIVSDIHIRYPDEERFQALLQLISQIDTKSCEKFMLLGDIFDFCFGRSPYCRKLFLSLGEALEGLYKKGVQVIYQEGNHEFAMKDIGWRGIEFLTDRTYKFSQKDKVVATTHGDLLSAPWHYYPFRSFLKSGFLAFCCRWLVPQKWFYELCLSFAKHSRNQDEYRDLNHERILGSAKQWLEEERAQIGFFGHFHVPYFFQDEAKSQAIMSGLSWDQPTAMAYSADRGFFRYMYDPKAGAFMEETAKSFTG